MGAVGEKISRGINHSIKTNSLYNDFKIRWSKNDGSGLFFDAISKTSKLAQLAEEKIPYISLCTDPTTEERLILCYVRDINISEPGLNWIRRT
jgi:acetyl-CoA carboxylase carboxyl transferase subunit beta